jgi:hypothetical protein
VFVTVLVVVRVLDEVTMEIVVAADVSVKEKVDVVLDTTVLVTLVSRVVMVVLVENSVLVEVVVKVVDLEIVETVVVVVELVFVTVVVVEVDPEMTETVLNVLEIEVNVEVGGGTVKGLSHRISKLKAHGTRMNKGSVGLYKRQRFGGIPPPTNTELMPHDNSISLTTVKTAPPARKVG